jgi:hypothetical protein
VTTAVAAALARRRTLTAVAVGLIAVPGSVVMGVVAVAMGTTAPPAAELSAALGIPAIAFDAYQRAAATAPSQACGLRWQILAGIARIESNHAEGHTIATDGTVTPPILGPTLDGSADHARIADSDDGVLDEDANFDRAIGPMQFLPGSWRHFGIDGNGDGAADANNLYDAAAGAAAHLCASAAGTLRDEQALRAALFAYNHSDSYVQAVLEAIRLYDEAASSSPGVPSGGIVTVAGIRVDASLAQPLSRLLTAAADEGLQLAGSGYRTTEEQLALRRAHCGTSHYALYDMPPSACTPPTARPGDSLHERGLAIDFTCAGALVTSRDPCFAFLATHAAAFGLFNLPAEPWHWSTTGG